MVNKQPVDKGEMTMNNEFWVSPAINGLPLFSRHRYFIVDD